MPNAAAQILPALMGKTYLDVNNVSSCASGPGKELKSKLFLPFSIIPKAHEI